MKNIKIITWLILLAFVASCKKEDELLKLTTDIPINITNSTAKLGGEVISDGGSTVTKRGICISRTINPVINDANNIKDVDMGNGIGIFSDVVSGLPVNTMLHARAFATNSKGTVYGEDKVFTTLSDCPLVNITADITTPTIWTTGNVYVIKSEIVVTSILTIEKGVVIKFNNTGRLRVNNSGKIRANGISTERIIFTSIADDSYCGDSNGDGALTSPQKGDWLNLYLNGGTANTFNYCDFLYAGANDGGYRCAVVISVAGPSFTFDNCTFAHTATSTNFTSQFTFYGSSYMSDPAVSVFTNNVFYDNNIPIYLNATYSINPNNSYSNPTNLNQKNTRNCIWMYPNGGSNVAVTYDETEVSYVMDGYLQKSTGSMNIGAGVVMKFPIGNGYGLNVGGLTLSANAFLTSIKDDAHGGDTNGDGSATAPAPADWYGYYNWNTSAWVNGANILYAAN